MGMFDYVRVEGHILPGLDPILFEERQNENKSLAEGPAIFQTKDLENCLGTYVIKDGNLFERIYETEKIPEEEKAEDDEHKPSFFRPVLRRTGRYEDRDLDYHGTSGSTRASKSSGWWRTGGAAGSISRLASPTATSRGSDGSSETTTPPSLADDLRTLRGPPRVASAVVG